MLPPGVAAPTRLRAASYREDIKLAVLRWVTREYPALAPRWELTRTGTYRATNYDRADAVLTARYALARHQEALLLRQPRVWGDFCAALAGERRVATAAKRAPRAPKGTVSTRAPRAPRALDVAARISEADLAPLCEAHRLRMEREGAHLGGGLSEEAAGGDKPDKRRAKRGKAEGSSGADAAGEALYEAVREAFGRAVQREAQTIG